MNRAKSEGERFSILALSECSRKTCAVSALFFLIGLKPRILLLEWRLTKIELV